MMNAISKECTKLSTKTLAPQMAEEDATASDVTKTVTDDLPIQHGITPAVAGVDEVEVLSTTKCTPCMFDDDVSEEPICCALYLCRAPNATNEEFVICINCNHQSHKIHTEKLSIQHPMDDNLIMTWKDFLGTGKERFKKTQTRDKQNVFYCILCKSPIIQVKLHGVECCKPSKHCAKNQRFQLPPLQLLGDYKNLLPATVR